MTPAGVPTTLTALGVARLRGTTDVVYAVAGDDAIYRFSTDGAADQRIAPAGVAGPSVPEARPAPSGPGP